ncbi:hypothetical protein CFD26_104589 [Aspergillus turcosus]|uniref:Uncharacterized protein n=1 Tax=Aspergillus turcosus TaxID=1245748 RepID=A0A421D512_9EURO|nr:hypothetical protein CFD26_104589 [Aspergillus turcosus]
MAPIKRSINALAKLKDNENGVARWFPLLLNHEPNGLPDVDLLREIDQDELISLERSSNLQCTITRARYVPKFGTQSYTAIVDGVVQSRRTDEVLSILEVKPFLQQSAAEFRPQEHDRYTEDGAVDSDIENGSPSKYKSLAAQASAAFECRFTTYPKLSPTCNQILTVIKIGNPSSSYAFPPLALLLITTHTSITSSQTNMANPTAMTGADALQEPLPNLKVQCLRLSSSTLHSAALPYYHIPDTPLTAAILEDTVEQTLNMVSRYNRQVLRKGQSLVFVDVPDAEDQRDSRQRCRINSDFAAVVYALIDDLRSSSQPPSGLAALSWFDEVLVPVEEAPQVLDDEELLAVLEEPKVRKMTRSGKIYGGKVTSSVDMGLAGKTLRQQLKEAKDRVEAKAQKE